MKIIKSIHLIFLCVAFKLFFNLKKLHGLSFHLVTEVNDAVKEYFY